MIQLDDSGLQSTHDQVSIQQEPLLHAKHSKNLPEKSERDSQEKEEEEEEKIVAGTSSPIIYEDPFIDNDGMENTSDSSVGPCNSSTSTNTSSSDSSDSEPPPPRMKQTKKTEKAKKQKHTGVTAKEKKKELKKKQLRSKLQTQRVLLKKATKELQTTLKHLEKLHK